MKEETYFTEHKDLVKEFTYNTYVPISCGDAYELDPLRALFCRNGISVTAAPASSAYYFGNHPLRWVQLMGRIICITYATPSIHPSLTRTSFDIIDGLGGNSIECTTFDKQIAEDMPLKEGDMVLVWGRLELWANLGLKISKCLKIPHQSVPFYYFLREIIVGVRKYVLERDADEFREVWPYSLGEPVKSVHEIEIPQTAKLRRFIEQKREEWCLLESDYETEPILPNLA